MGAINMLKKKVKKSSRRMNEFESAKFAAQQAWLMMLEWDDGTWFESWAGAQPTSKEDLMQWAQDVMKQAMTTDNECCRTAFFLCVFLELVGWKADYLNEFDGFA